MPGLRRGDASTPVQLCHHIIVNRIIVVPVYRMTCAIGDQLGFSKSGTKCSEGVLPHWPPARGVVSLGEAVTARTLACCSLGRRLVIAVLVREEKRKPTVLFTVPRLSVFNC